MVLTRVRFALLSVPLILALVAPAAGADDLSTRQANNRKKQQELASKLDLERASGAQVEAEKARLDKAVVAQARRADDAARGLAVAQADLNETSTRMARLQSETDRLRKAMEGRALYAYLHPAPSLIQGITDAPTMVEAGRRMALLGHVQASSDAVLDRFKAARKDLAEARDERRTAQEAAAKRAQEEAAARNRLDAARQRQQKAHEELQKRVAGLQAEISALAADDAKIRALLASAAASSAATLQNRGSGNASPSGTQFPTPTRGGFIWPVRGPVMSEYGDRWGGFHSGMDIGAVTGTAIAAAKTGVVVYAGWSDGGYGNLVLVDHGGGLATAYAHQSRVAASVGQVVNQGQTLGYVGCTGNCSGQHLHLEVRVNGSPQNPRSHIGGSP